MDAFRVVVAGILVVLATTTGCSVKSPPSPEQSYLTFVKSKIDVRPETTDASLLRLGRTDCEALRSNNSVRDVVTTGVIGALLGGATIEYATSLVSTTVSGAAIYLCPDQRSSVQEQLTRESL